MMWYVYVGIGLIVFLYFGFSYLMYRKIFFIANKESYQVVDQTDPFFSPSWDWFQKAPRETVSIKAYDNTLLKGVYLPSQDEKSLNTAIVVHGYHSNLNDVVALAKMYSDFGFKVLLIDQRGHGMSNGTFTSFSHVEKYDLKKWIQFALRTYGQTDKVLLHGVSMGGATVLEATKLALPDNVKFIVSDSSFSTFTGLLKSFLKPRILMMFYPGLNFFSYTIHRYWLWRIKPVKTIKQSGIPLFIIHGEEDSMVPFSMGEAIYASSGGLQKTFYPVKNAEHGKGYVLEKEEIENKLGSILPAYFQIKKAFLKQKK